MKKCSNCGAEIPKDAAYCDICGALCSKRLIARPPEEKKRIEKRRAGIKRAVKIVLAVAGGCFAALIVVALISGYVSEKRYEKREKARDLTGWEVTVTPEEFSKLDIGMTYEEIVRIIGGEGKVVEDSDYVTSYMWPGEHYINPDFGYLTVDFYNHSDTGSERLTADYIEECDILDGSETYETYRKIYGNEHSAIDAPVVTKDQVSKVGEGMSYEKVSELLGEGKMCSSSTRIDAYGSDRYTDYAWRCKMSGQDSEFELHFENGILKYYSDWILEYID